MEWFIAYLLSVILIPTISAMVFTTGRDSKSEIILREPPDVLGAVGWCLAWPICLPIGIFNGVKKARTEKLTTEANRVMRDYYINEMNVQDRTRLLAVPEHKLKHLFKAYRSKLIALNAAQAEMIREELLNRNMERNLLK